LKFHRAFNAYKFMCNFTKHLFGKLKIQMKKKVHCKQVIIVVVVCIQQRSHLGFACVLDEDYKPCYGTTEPTKT